MKYSATIEWLCERTAIIRVHEKESATLGEEYVWCCTVKKEGDVAHIKGVAKPLTISMAKEVEKLLVENGMPYRKHERRKPAKSREFQRRMAS